MNLSGIRPSHQVLHWIRIALFICCVGVVDWIFAPVVPTAAENLDSAKIAVLESKVDAQSAAITRMDQKVEELTATVNKGVGATCVMIVVCTLMSGTVALSLRPQKRSNG